MKTREFLLATLLGVTVIGSGGAAAQDRDRDYVSRCGNCGTVTGIEQVEHKDSHVGAGTAIGAVAGGVLGSTVGKGKGRTAATIGGAVAGGAVGHKIEKDRRGRDVAWRFDVEMDSGRHVTVMQDDNPDIRSGDRVRVFNGRLERL